MRTLSMLTLASLLVACGTGPPTVVEGKVAQEKPALPPGLTYALSTSIFDYDVTEPGPLYGGCVGQEAVEIAGDGTNPLFSPDGFRLAVTAGGSVKILNLESRAVRNLGPSILQPMAWSPDGSRLAVMTDQGLGVIDVTTLEYHPVSGAAPFVDKVRWSSRSGNFFFGDSSDDPSLHYRVASATVGPDGSWTGSTLLDGFELFDGREGLLAVQDGDGMVTVRSEDGGDPLGPPLGGETIEVRLAPGGSRMLIRSFAAWYVAGVDGKRLGYLEEAFYPAWTNEGLLVVFYGNALGLLDVDAGQRRLFPIFPMLTDKGLNLIYEGADVVQLSSCPAWATEPGVGPLIGG